MVNYMPKSGYRRMYGYGKEINRVSSETSLGIFSRVLFAFPSRIAPVLLLVLIYQKDWPSWRTLKQNVYYARISRRTFAHTR